LILWKMRITATVLWMENVVSTVSIETEYELRVV